MLLFIFFLTVVFSLIGSFLIEKFSLKYVVLDKPSNRSSHKLPTPTVGGLAILISYFIYFLMLSNFVHIYSEPLSILLISLIPIVIIGLIDDFKEINIFARLATQFFVALFFVGYFQINTLNLEDNIYSQSSIIVIILSILLSVWLMNLYNFMDGIDGYASIECIFVSFAASLIIYLNNSESLIYLYLLGLGFSVTGFIIMNWHPARIFMGDTGSVAIGCIFAFFTIYTGNESVISIYTWLILLSVFISDSTYTLIVRIVTKTNVLKPHLTHGFHIVTRKNKSQLFTLCSLFVINIVWVLPLALLSNIFINYHIIITFIAYLPLILYLINIGAGLENGNKI
ncbi:MAG: hypothetical protein HN613_02265 [Gammaproteobacteria bacterium]|jgi:Fuc2NAc and GlcNAc transferase|nr:hypothetical protein [Gammaproteobacteria bacterium]MBT7603545.1 hypothetical protein [Gammaproteobacteria bacterium]